MAFFRTYWCRAGAPPEDHNRCQDGAAVNCPCSCHRTGERMARYCDASECGVRPATSKKHPNGVRLCSVCEAFYIVDDRGSLIPRNSFNRFLASCAADCVEGR